MDAQQSLAARKEVSELQAVRDKAREDQWTYLPKQELERRDPSLADGLDPEKLKRWRRHVYRIVHHIGQQLKIPQWVIAVAATLCHRFFSRRSMKRNDRTVIAMACMHLAAKMEESPKSIREVVREGSKMVQPPQTFDAEGLERLKEEVLTAERAVLYTLGFDLALDHPYRELVRHMSSLGLLQSGNQQGPPEMKRLMQNTWNFVNDSFRTNLCLQYRPEKIAATALFLANQLNRAMYGDIGDITPAIERLTPGGFYEHFGVSLAELEDIGGQILDVFENVKKANAGGPPLVSPIVTAPAFSP